jgi:hypothetical protein
MPTRALEPTQPRMSSSLPHPAHPVQPAQANIFGDKPITRLGMIADDSTLDIPAFKRRNSEAGTTRLSTSDEIETNGEFDIPAFLRKRGD